ncbi:hypothetical protein LOAG_18737 [Loa loa]|uniref:DUF7153 domain-containing protein n=1 Tax=Loa loa TaxID=7209 RepID=A0A1I7VSU2_LOALO|nr:hypothetical protein LOAG_18737 [Loa loa]EJD73875.1 hypothetical protein LOAG_18737 [Loa loa]
MNSIHGFLRRFLPNRLNRNGDDFSFELLRSASAQELKKRDNLRQQLMWPRPTSSHEHFHINATNLEGDEMIEILGENGERIRNDETALLGFVECTSDEYNRIGPSTTESLLNRAIAECNIIRSNPYFSDGILLKCIDSKPLYLYLHYALFKNPDHDMRIAQIDHAIHELHNQPKTQFGAYDETYAIQKTSSLAGYKLPSHRHAGYIIILFKLLDEQTRHENLEKSWLSWSGAREIYKYSPRSWNLRRIVLHKMPTSKKKNFRPFAYVLFCEFGNILNPSNRLQALNMVERLRVRNCGYISLYQVQWSYGRISNSHETPSNSQELLSVPEGKWERNLMLRGFSQEVEPTTTDISKPANNRKHSSRSMGMQSDKQSVFHSYHHFGDFG